MLRHFGHECLKHSPQILLGFELYALNLTLFVRTLYVFERHLSELRLKLQTYIQWVYLTDTFSLFSIARASFGVLGLTRPRCCSQLKLQIDAQSN